jgi:hypothetical protein
MGSILLTPEAEMHQYAHLQASIQKQLTPQQPQETQDKGMLNSAQNVANSITA